MAIYEYQCSTCGERLEVMQPMSATPLHRCGEHCVAKHRSGKGAVSRVFSVPNVGKSSSGNPGGSDFGGGDMPSCGSCGRMGPDVCN